MGMEGRGIAGDSWGWLGMGYGDEVWWWCIRYGGGV